MCLCLFDRFGGFQKLIFQLAKQHHITEDLRQRVAVDVGGPRGGAGEKILAKREKEEKKISGKGLKNAKRIERKL